MEEGEREPRETETDNSRQPVKKSCMEVRIKSDFFFKSIFIDLFL